MGDPQRHARFFCRERHLDRDAAVAVERGASAWRRTAPTSSTSAANRPVQGPSRSLPTRSWRASFRWSKALAKRLRVPISVDTYQGRRRARGARRRRDDRQRRQRPAIRPALAARRRRRSGAALVLMHTRGRPKTMYAEAVYARCDRGGRGRAEGEHGAAPDGRRAARTHHRRPGIGFAKRPAHSYGVLARLPELAAALDRPVLVGPSRKSFMRDALGDRPAAGARLGHGGGGDRRGARRRAHRARARRGRDGAGRASGRGDTGTAMRRRPDIDAGRTMNWLTDFFAARHRLVGYRSTSSSCRSSSTRSSS